VRIGESLVHITLGDFVAVTTISIATCAKDEMRTLLEDFFQSGHCAAFANLKADLSRLSGIQNLSL
jgi:hypothetical protein